MSKENRFSKIQVSKIGQLIDVLLHAKDLSQEDIAKIHRWLVSDEHEDLKSAVFIDRLSKSLQFGTKSKYAQQMWPELARRLGLSSYTSKEKHPLPLRRTGRLSRRVLLRFAAVLIPVAMVFGGYLWWNSSRTDSGNGPLSGFVALHSISTGEEDTKQIILADGTQVTLNRNTKFSYNDKREAELDGEAWFKVAKDSAHPFTIHAGHLSATVLGTEFNFRARAGEGVSALSLYSGVVRLDYAGEESLLDTAGQEFTLDHSTARASLRTFDPAQKPQWFATGVSLLNMMSLDAIFDQIEAAYGVTISGREAVDTSRRYNFTLDRTLSIDEVMSALEYVNGRFGYTLDGTTITLAKKQR